MRRTDKETWNSRPSSFVYDLAFLDPGKALITYQDTYLDASIVSVSIARGRIILKGDGKSISFDFANGQTSGAGTAGIFKFDVASLNFQRRIDLDSPSFVGLRNFPTCSFVSRQLQVAAYDFFGVDTNGALEGALQTNRYGSVVAGGWRASKDTDSFSDVRAEFERRRAEMTGCTVSIDGVAYGLEMLSAPGLPSDREDLFGSVYRLKNAPYWLSPLRAAVVASWGGSPWVTVYAGRPPNATLSQLEERMSARSWVSVSEGTAAPPSLLDQAAHQALIAQANSAEASADHATAAKLRNQACSRFLDLDACYEAANAINLGRGVAQNTTEALRRYEAGCAANHGNACWSLGAELRDRDDIELQKKAAFALLKSCNLRVGKSCASLGIFIEKGGALIVSGPDGEGGRFATAYRLYKRGCQYDDSASCRNAGITAHYGEEGVPVDLASAAQFHAKACRLGEAKSCSYQAPGIPAVSKPPPPKPAPNKDADKAVDDLLNELDKF